MCQLFSISVVHVSYLSISVIIWLMVPAEPTKPKPEKPQPSSELNPFAFLSTFAKIDWSNLWDVFLVRFLCGLGVLVYRSNFALMLDYKYEASSKVTGYITSFGAIVGTLAGFLMGHIAHLYKDQHRLYLHANILQFTAILIIAISPSLWILIVCIMPLAISTQVARVCSANILIERGHGQEKGALLGLGASVLSISRMLSPALGGFAQEYFLSGPAILGAISSGLGLLVLLVAPWIRKKQKLKEL